MGCLGAPVEWSARKAHLRPTEELAGSRLTLSGWKTAYREKKLVSWMWKTYENVCARALSISYGVFASVTTGRLVEGEGRPNRMLLICWSSWGALLGWPLLSARVPFSTGWTTNHLLDPSRANFLKNTWISRYRRFDCFCMFLSPMLLA